jgi:hypothetical protein
VKILALLLLSGQVCVVHSVERGPVVSEYCVSGTTYAPEGIIFDSTGMQVIYFLYVLQCVCIIQGTLIATCDNYFSLKN